MSFLALNECPQTIILMKKNFISTHSIGLIISWKALHLFKRDIRSHDKDIWFDIMPFDNRCLLSGSHLGLLSLMKVLEGERKALEVMLNSTSFFIKIFFF